MWSVVMIKNNRKLGYKKRIKHNKIMKSSYLQLLRKYSVKKWLTLIRQLNIKRSHNEFNDINLNLKYKAEFLVVNTDMAIRVAKHIDNISEYPVANHCDWLTSAEINLSDGPTNLIKEFGIGGMSLMAVWQNRLIYNQSNMIGRMHVLYKNYDNQIISAIGISIKDIYIILLAIGLIFVLLENNIAFSQNNNSKTKKLMPRPPIFGIPAKTLPQGRFIYRSYFTYSDYTQMYNSKQNQMINLPLGMSFQSYSYTPKLRYGLTNNITLIANFPFYYKHLEKGNNTKEGIGIGDAIFAGLYRFYFNKKNHFLLSGLLFSKFPTGKSTNLETNELPLGTGSIDGGLAFLPEKEFGKLDIRLSAFYIFRSENKENVNLGNVQSYSISAAYNFTENFVVESTLLYKSIANNKIDGKEINNSDANLSQLILGTQYRLAPTFLLQLAAPINLSAKMPFKSDYDLWFGIYYLI